MIIDTLKNSKDEPVSILFKVENWHDVYTLVFMAEHFQVDFQDYQAESSCMLVPLNQNYMYSSHAYIMECYYVSRCRV